MSLLRRFCGSEFQTVGPETRKLYENRSAVSVHVGRSDWMATTLMILQLQWWRGLVPPTQSTVWHSHTGRTVHQTFNARRPCLPSGFGTCVGQLAVVCHECTVADDVPSRAEDCTFSVVVWQWFGDRDCIPQYNCCLPATTDSRRFCPFCFV